MCWNCWCDKSLSFAFFWTNENQVDSWSFPIFLALKVQTKCGAQSVQSEKDLKIKWRNRFLFFKLKLRKYLTEKNLFWSESYWIESGISIIVWTHIVCFHQVFSNRVFRTHFYILYRLTYMKYLPFASIKNHRSLI